MRVHQMVYPSRSYPSYKPSAIPWLGDVPAHWEVLPGKACYSLKQIPNKGLRETTVLSLSYGQIKIRPEERLHGLVPESFETYQIIEPADIICRPTDLQNDWTSLRFGLSPYAGIITSAYMCFHTRATLTREYGYTLLHTYDLKKVFYGLGSGLRQNLSWSDFKFLPCLAPPVPEQTAIVRYLDHADRRIRRYVNAKRKLIALLEEEKQAVINRAVTRGLDPNVRLKPSGVEWLGDVPEHWEVRRLKQISVIQTGITLGKDYGDAELVKRSYLRVANVQAGRLDLSEVTTVRVPHTEIKRATLKTGDVLMTEGGDIDKLGRGCTWLGDIPDCLHQNHIFAVRPSLDVLNPAFLVVLMGSLHGRTYFQVTAKKTTNLATTNRTTLGNCPLYLPSLIEQQTILDYIAEQCDAPDAAIDRARRQIELLQEYRTRLIADVVTGKLDVREAATQLPDEPDGEEPGEAHLAAEADGELPPEDAWTGMPIPL